MFPAALSQSPCLLPSPPPPCRRFPGFRVSRRRRRRRRRPGPCVSPRVSRRRRRYAAAVPSSLQPPLCCRRLCLSRRRCRRCAAAAPVSVSPAVAAASRLLPRAVCRPSSAASCRLPPAATAPCFLLLRLRRPLSAVLTFKPPLPPLLPPPDLFSFFFEPSGRWLGKRGVVAPSALRPPNPLSSGSRVFRSVQSFGPRALRSQHSNPLSSGSHVFRPVQSFGPRALRS